LAAVQDVRDDLRELTGKVDDVQGTGHSTLVRVAVLEVQYTSLLTQVRALADQKDGASPDSGKKKNFLERNSITISSGAVAAIISGLTALLSKGHP
jgi:hypothetical protein